MGAIGCLVRQAIAYRFHEPTAHPLKDLGFLLLPELGAHILTPIRSISNRAIRRRSSGIPHVLQVLLAVIAPVRLSDWWRR